MIKNLFSAIPPDSPDEVFEQLACGKSFTLKRIVSRGHTSDWYTQEKNEWVVLLSGAARLQFEDSMVELKPGDSLSLPANCKHRVSWTDPEQESVWLALYFDA